MYKTCNQDPLNALADRIRASNEGAASHDDVVAPADELARWGIDLPSYIERFDALERPGAAGGRRLIPVRVQ